ncbi:Sporulation related domain protein [Marinomonas aquimarina]|uniref:Sporulation related domain protein n=1 Tax=Marinomonas aquimarina TaxID=295068 RepID=A0A1A8T3X4_9GAMM|nr:SPOR domain-containing protein [Marinomonas aquimarina]SBS26584.1 Sporulation related domain protein [Marinomonas aquimarina]
MGLKLLVVCTGAIWLAGCTLTPEKKGTMTNAELQQALQTQQQEWEDMKPQLQRILALESDLKLLVETLDTVPESSESLTQEMAPAAEAAQQANQAPVLPSAALADINAQTADAGSTAPISTSANRSDKPFRQGPPSNAVTAEFQGGSKTKADAGANTQYYGVQLAAYGSEQQAIQGWQSITQRYAEEFADTAPLINRHQVKGKTYYQLIVGPFLKKAYSVDFCNMLKQMQQDCLVTRYKGDPFLSL